MESTTDSPLGSEAVEAIVDWLTTVADRGHARQRVFADWLDTMLYSFQGRDDPYLEIVERYDPDEIQDAPRDPDAERDAAIDQFATATGELIHASKATELDVLGDVYTAFGQRSDAFGQFFTPHTVATAMARIMVTVDDRLEDAADGEPPAELPADPTTIADPACGSGRLLVACRPYAPAGIYVGQDKDQVCAKMTAVNLAVFGLSGYAIHGDSLTLDQYRAWEVVNPPYGPPRCIELDPGDDPVPLGTPRETATERMTSPAPADDPEPADSDDAKLPAGEFDTDPAGAATASETATSITQVTLADLAGLTDRTS